MNGTGGLIQGNGGGNGDGNDEGGPAGTARRRERQTGKAGASGGTGKTGDRWWGMCHSTGSSTSGKAPIRFGTYSIRNGRNGGLEAALRGMYQTNMDLGILQETKLTDGIYTRGSAGSSVIARDALSRHRGGYR